MTCLTPGPACLSTADRSSSGNLTQTGPTRFSAGGWTAGVGSWLLLVGKEGLREPLSCAGGGRGQRLLGRAEQVHSCSSAFSDCSHSHRECHKAFRPLA